ncbi:MAG: sulfur carrier protein ThiS [Acidobacteriota bacterium]|nr:sulfur carrier protein ThiS [Acidobacteriota bacterium]MDH3786692.1 sulfur carrier protein ThiS [Acidobacteriota bacterium]
MTEYRLNGESLPFEQVTMDELVARLAAAPQGVAVARNGRVVPRRDWQRVQVEVDDEIEIVVAVQGG